MDILKLRVTVNYKKKRNEKVKKRKIFFAKRNGNQRHEKKALRTEEKENGTKRNEK